VPQLLFCGLALIVAGCGSGRTISAGMPSQGSTGGTATVDFASQIQPIFTTNCALSGCHASDTASGELILDAGKAYAALVNVVSSEVAPEKRVAPENSAASYLIEKLASAQPRSGDKMPLGSDP